MDILVKEVQRGQDILEWDARKGTVPRGLRMKWRLHAESLRDRLRAAILSPP